MKCFIFYFGCKNIEKYFDKNSIIKIDIGNKEKNQRTLKIIQNAISDNLFEKNITAIENNFKKAMDLSIQNNIINIIKNYNILPIKKRKGLPLFEYNNKKIKTHHKIPLKAFYYIDFYKNILKTITKIIKMKISKKHNNVIKAEYNTTYDNIK